MICKAQPKYGFENYLFQRTHFIFSFTPTYCFKAKTQLTAGTQDLYPQNLLGAEAGLNVVFNLSDELGLKTGIQGGATPFDFGYKITSPYDSLFGHPIQDEYATAAYGFDGYFFGYINVPVQIEFRQKISDNKFFLGAAGLALKWTFAQKTIYGYNASTSDSTSETFLEITAEKASKHPTAPLILSAGVGFVLKNKNMLVVNLKSETGFENVVKGEFIFSRGSTYQSAGNYTKKGSYIGLEVGYRLTKGRESQSLTSPDSYEYIHNKGHLNIEIDSTTMVSIFKRNQIGVSLAYQFGLKPVITSSIGGKPDISTIPYPQLGLDYTFNKNKNWGIKTGLNYTLYQYQYNNITYNSSSPFISPYTTDLYFALDLFTLSSSFEYRYQLKKSLMLYGDLGFTAGMFGERGVTYLHIIDYNTTSPQNIVTGQVHHRVLMGSNFGLGVLYAAKNYNLWRFGANWFNSFTTGATENYSFNNGAANQQTGTTAIKGSNVAVTVGYIYSFAPSPYAIEKRKLKIQSMEQLPLPYVTSNVIDSIYTKNQFALTGQLNFMIQPEAKAELGKTPNINTYGSTGLKADYLFNFNKHWSATAGLSIGKYDYEASSYLINDTDSIGYNYYIENVIAKLSLNAMVEYRLPLSRTALWYTDIGLSISGDFNRSYNYLSQTEQDSTWETISNTNSNNLNYGGLIGTGILLTMRNYNQFKIGVQYYQAFTTLLKQDYDIRTTNGKPLAAGTMTTSGNYISVNFGYVFSFKKNGKH
ncbi:MAG: hypothetical protein ABI723_14210 [Bacteroidia bacterium]